MELKGAERGRVEAVTSGGLTWVNIEKPTQKEMSILAQNYPFHHLALEDCLSKIQLTKIDKHEDYLFLLLHFPSLRNEGRVILPSQLSIFLGKNYLVTIHQGDIKPLSEKFQACKKDEQARQSTICKSSAYLLYRIIDGLVDSFFPILDKVLGELNEIEDWVFDERVEVVREVSVLRREIAVLRRIAFPLKRVVVDLVKEASRYTADDLSIYFSDVQDHMDKVWETLEECKETIEIYKDTDFMLSTEKTSKILAILTIIFTLSIPATVVGTLYGMNIHLPGGIQTGPWILPFFGVYTTFIILLIASAIPALLMLWYFRRLGWL